MSLDFYVGEVQAQTSAATKLAAEYSQFSGQLKDSVNAFFTAPLTGKAYDSAKRLGEKRSATRNKRKFTKIALQIFVNFLLFPKELLLLPPFFHF
ncbi:hypothetical protein ACSFB8_12025 [Enterococcus faecalis]